jgi:hypothetical protein
MSRPRLRRAGAAASVALALLTLAACVPEPGATPSTTPRATTTLTPTPTPIATRTPGATPSAHAILPTDCRAMLTDEVLDELGDIPLNDPALGPSGVQSDGTLICIWADPAADTTHLKTTISTMSRGPALDMLNELADAQGFVCYTPDGGTRCEKTWTNDQHPVTDGRTAFWRDGILIDTTFSNLAPSGYTSAIVESIFG